MLFNVCWHINFRLWGAIYLGVVVYLQETRLLIRDVMAFDIATFHSRNMGELSEDTHSMSAEDINNISLYKK